MIGISCKSGNIFSMIVKDFADAEWKLQEKYYVAQGCVIVNEDGLRFTKCDCEHCNSLEHDFENLIQEIVDNNQNKY